MRLRRVDQSTGVGGKPEMRKEREARARSNNFYA